LEVQNFLKIFIEGLFFKFSILTFCSLKLFRLFCFPISADPLSTHISPHFIFSSLLSLKQNQHKTVWARFCGNTLYRRTWTTNLPTSQSKKSLYFKCSISVTWW
jgi:hypothetical protein